MTELQKRSLFRLAELSGVPICAAISERSSNHSNNTQNYSLQRYPSASDVPLVLQHDHDFLNTLVQNTDISYPCIKTDQYGVTFACVRIFESSDAIIIGPVSDHRIKNPYLSIFLRSHGVFQNEEEISVLSNSRLYALIELVYTAVNETEITRYDMLEKNGIGSQFRMEMEQEKFNFNNQQENRDHLHHSYYAEKKILDAIRTGDGKTAIALSMKMDPEIGEMSKNAVINIRKLVVTAITLSCRAAIDSGVDPAKAYRISDWNLQKMDECTSTAELIECRNHAIWDFTNAVSDHLQKPSRSGYSNLAKNYIAQHYREKIRIEDIARKIGISPSYLSRTFSHEMGISISEYVTQVRIEKASNLLKYSDATITQIGEYVHFSSTGYFCKVFKKRYGLLPLAYRAKYKPSEFK